MTQLGEAAVANASDGQSGREILIPTLVTPDGSVLAVQLKGAESGASVRTSHGWYNMLPTLGQQLREEGLFTSGRRSAGTSWLENDEHHNSR
jgi:hypothetical protein